MLRTVVIAASAYGLWEMLSDGRVSCYPWFTALVMATFLAFIAISVLRLDGKPIIKF